MIALDRVFHLLRAIVSSSWLTGIAVDLRHGFFGLCSPLRLQDLGVRHRSIYSHASSTSHGSVYDFIPCEIDPAMFGVTVFDCIRYEFSLCCLT